MPTMLATSGDVTGGEMIGETQGASSGNKRDTPPCVYVGRAARGVCVCVVAEDVKNVCAGSLGLKMLTLRLGAG